MNAVEPMSGFRPGVSPDVRGPASTRGPLRPAGLASTRRRISSTGIVRAFSTLDAGLMLATVIGAGEMAGGLLALPFAAVLPPLIGSAAALAMVRAVRRLCFPQAPTAVDSPCQDRGRGLCRRDRHLARGAIPWRTAHDGLDLDRSCAPDASDGPYPLVAAGAQLASGGANDPQRRRRWSHGQRPQADRRRAGDA